MHSSAAIGFGIDRQFVAMVEVTERLAPGRTSAAPI
jgi:hypothetical protein